jgi:hypothetical protein
VAIIEERPQHLERREQLLAVAKKIFAERGFQSTTMIKLENNPKLGYYTVGQTRHYIKPQALIAATKTNHCG